MFSGKLGKDMMIQQGYVPSTCTLSEEHGGTLIWIYTNKGLDVCSDCNEDRNICKGRPKTNEIPTRTNHN